MRVNSLPMYGGSMVSDTDSSPVNQCDSTTKEEPADYYYF